MRYKLVLLIVVVGGAFALGSLFDVRLQVVRRPLLSRLWPSLAGKSTVPSPAPTPAALSAVEPARLQEQVLPASGLELPIKWGDLGQRLVKLGVIDKAKFVKLYAGRGSSSEAAKLLESAGSASVRITPQNSGLWLNLLWAFGLANKNAILETGPMVDPQYGGAGNFASTGGWSLGKSGAMAYYSQSRLVTLTAEQQQLVVRVAKNIYRPCCGNSTYFPDCNHGMAMLGLLELLAANGVKEPEMYRIALRVNSYWFPDTYLTIATYLTKQGTSWDQADPRQILGQDYSSATGYRRILSQVKPVQLGGGGGCGV